MRPKTPHAIVAALLLGSAIHPDLATAGPKIDVTTDVTTGGLNRYTFALDPDGETGYTAVDVRIEPLVGVFNQTSSNPIFVTPSEDSGVLGVGTVTVGYSLLGVLDSPDAVGFTFTSLGGPATSAFSGPLAQVTTTEVASWIAVFRFANAEGQELTDFEQILIPIVPHAPEPATIGCLAVTLAWAPRRRR